MIRYENFRSEEYWEQVLLATRKLVLTKNQLFNKVTFLAMLDVLSCRYQLLQNLWTTKIFTRELLTHCGWVTQIYVYVLQLWKTADEHLRF